MRAVKYGQSPEELQIAINKVISIIVNGLDNEGICYSPVRRSGNFITLSKEKYRNLLSEIDELKSQRSSELLAAATADDRPSERMHWFKKCVAVNPASVDCWLGLGEEYRRQENYEESIASLTEALSLDRNRVEIYRQLGVSYNKSGNLDAAIHSFQRAIGISDDHAETWSNFGGVLRRKGMKELPDESGWDILRSAKNSYEKAEDIDENDMYAILNIAKLSVILSKKEPDLLDDAVHRFEIVRPLCQFKVHRRPNDYWERFNLADTYIFSDLKGEGTNKYKEAIDIVPKKYRKDVLSSVSSPLKNMLDLEVLPEDIANAMLGVIEILSRVANES